MPGAYCTAGDTANFQKKVADSNVSKIYEPIASPSSLGRQVKLTAIMYATCGPQHCVGTSSAMAKQAGSEFRGGALPY